MRVALPFLPAFLVATGIFAAEIPPTGRPNVVFVIVDDLRWDCMGVAGHPHLVTPHMDALARSGARMKEAFVVTSLCSPSRASFLTGRYPHQHKIRDNHLKNTSPDLLHFENAERTFPAILKKAGYATAYIGKFHVTPDGHPQKGFDTWMALPGQGKYIDPEYNIQGKTEKFRGHVDDVTGDHAVAWLKDPSRKEKPFCLCVGFKAPHAPQTPPERYKDWLADVSIPKPASYAEDYAAGAKPDVIAKSTLRAEVFPHNIQKKGWDLFIKDFYRSIRGVDDNLGKILAALAETGLDKTTLVVFTGDNGFFLGEHGMVDKRLAYEESLRVPILARFPGRVREEAITDKIALSIDIAPTILDFCGIPPPEDMAGRSLVAHLAGNRPAEGWRSDFFYEYAEPPPPYLREGQDKGNIPVPFLVAVRSERHKYVEYLDSNGACELFDLSTDPHEMKNLSRDPARADLLSTMKKRLAEHQKELGWTPPPPPPDARK